jgi:hypothetical protein
MSEEEPTEEEQEEEKRIALLEKEVEEEISGGELPVEVDLTEIEEEDDDKIDWELEDEVPEEEETE